LFTCTVQLIVVLCTGIFDSVGNKPASALNHILSLKLSPGSGERRSYLTQSVPQVVLQKSISTQIRQHIFYISNIEEQVGEFVGDLTSAERL